MRRVLTFLCIHRGKVRTNHKTIQLKSQCRTLLFWFGCWFGFWFGNHIDEKTSQMQNVCLFRFRPLYLGFIY